jgi:hypothetical protein
MKKYSPVKLVIAVILFVSAILLFISGYKDIARSNAMPESSGLGGYAIWLGGMIQLGVGIVFVIAASVVLTRGKKK